MKYLFCLYYAFIILAILYKTENLARDIYFNISAGIRKKVFLLLEILLILFLFLLPIFLYGQLLK